MGDGRELEGAVPPYEVDAAFRTEVAYRTILNAATATSSREHRPAHGGTIEVSRSRLGGARFRVRLPLPERQCTVDGQRQRSPAQH